MSLFLFFVIDVHSHKPIAQLVIYDLVGRVRGNLGGSRLFAREYVIRGEMRGRMHILRCLLDEESTGYERNYGGMRSYNGQEKLETRTRIINCFLQNMQVLCILLCNMERLMN